MFTTERAVLLSDIPALGLLVATPQLSWWKSSCDCLPSAQCKVSWLNLKSPYCQPEANAPRLSPQGCTKTTPIRLVTCLQLCFWPSLETRPNIFQSSLSDAIKDKKLNSPVWAHPKAECSSGLPGLRQNSSPPFPNNTGPAELLNIQTLEQVNTNRQWETQWAATTISIARSL